MKILVIGDSESKRLWELWNDKTAERLADIDAIVSIGDLNASYLEFLVTMLNKPLLYVRGNHDANYDVKPPEGCIEIDEMSYEIKDSHDSAKVVRFTGLGGSMKYREARRDTRGECKEMFTEDEMSRRVMRIWRKIRLARHRKAKRTVTYVDVFVTHAPCRGYGDMEDLAHQGFECFNELLMKWKPAVHCFGHVHQEYGNSERELEHPSGTRLINCSGEYILNV